MTTSSATGLSNVSGTRQSLWVNRSGAVYLYQYANGAGASTCFVAGRKVSNLSGWQAAPGSVRLVAGTC